MVIKKFKHMHLIAVILSLFFVSLTIFTPLRVCYVRIAEVFRDLWTSLKYYFCEIFEISAVQNVTVVNKSSLKFMPIFNFPETSEEFQVVWNKFWALFANKQNLSEYFIQVGNTLFVISQFLILIGLPLFLILYFAFNSYLSKHNNNYNEISKPLKVFLIVIKHTYTPVKNWIVSFIKFCKEKHYLSVWLFICCFSLNIFAIVIDFFAYYFYFVISFDLSTIYIQFYKLFCDLSYFFYYVPVFVLVIIGIVIFCKICKSIGYKFLTHNENKNRGLINSLPVVVMHNGTMGTGKTTLNADMCLSLEIMFRDEAFKRILLNDLKFPNFPWINLENQLKLAIKKHKVYNLASCSEYIIKLRDKFYKKSVSKNVFNYDFERYGLLYNDGLKVIDIWEVISTYSKLYFIYVMTCSLMISNFSIRSDNILHDLGNFPIWQNDFFKTDSRLLDSYSRHAHIIDFDMLRLGKKLVEDSQYKDSFEFGIVSITEVGKERKNNLENNDKKKNDDTTNQKNDGFNSWLKMVRHSATVDNYPFVKVITDEQRATSWGADARDLCKLTYIDKKSDLCSTMPFMWLLETIHDFIFDKFENVYYQYRFNRADNTLFMFLFKSVFVKFHHWFVKLQNTFGYYRLDLHIEKGTQDGIVDKKNYYLSVKKIYSNRFSTDCFSDFFKDKALRSKVGLCDLPEYKNEKATFDELQQQNSYFIKEITNTFNKE